MNDLLINLDLIYMTKYTPHNYSPLPKIFLHPQTQLPARRPARDPIARGVELRHGRHGGDGALAAELRQLRPVRGVDVDEAVHVADAEAVDGVRGVEVPLGTEAVFFFVGG